MVQPGKPAAACDKVFDSTGFAAGVWDIGGVFVTWESEVVISDFMNMDNAMNAPIPKKPKAAKDEV